MIRKNKTSLINLILDSDIDKPTSSIKNEIYHSHGIKVSNRQIQRIRKNRKEQDKRKDDNMGPALTAHEHGIINMANQGGWSIQELATNNNTSADEVKNILRKFYFMVTGHILDTENGNVYFDPESEVTVEIENREDVFNTENDIVENDAEVIDLVDVVSTQDNTANIGGNESFWEVEIDIVSECSKCSSEVDVFMGEEARKKASLYMKWAGAREWLAYLVGSKQDDGSYHVNDLYLPDQRTSSVLVDKVDSDQYNQMVIVGVIHSHHEMGAGDEDNPSFSGHDAAFINGNHNLSLLAGRDRTTKGFKIVGIARAKTPCGALMKVKAKVQKMASEESEEVKELRTDFFAKTQTKQEDPPPQHTHVTNTVHGQQYHYNNGGYPGNQFNRNGGRGHCGR